MTNTQTIIITHFLWKTCIEILSNTPYNIQIMQSQNRSHISFAFRLKWIYFLGKVKN